MPFMSPDLRKKSLWDEVEWEGGIKSLSAVKVDLRLCCGFDNKIKQAGAELCQAQSSLS